MSLPPLSEKEIRDRIYTAVDGIGGEESVELLTQLTAEVPGWLKAHYEMEHSYPSPSGITQCRLQQWYKAKDYKRDQEIPRSWKARAAAGILVEPYWFAVMKLAGFDMTLPQETYKCGPLMITHPDALVEGLPWELKTITGWGYRYLLEGRGIAGEQAGHFAQMQLHLYATEQEWGLYIATPPDPNLLQSIMRQNKKYGRLYEMPLVYIEWVPRHEPEIKHQLERAEMLVEDLKSDDPPPREFDGREFDMTGKRTFPCGYCVNLKTCNEKYGYFEDIRYVT